jgi:PadR family transcriptional regulator PadR
MGLTNTPSDLLPGTLELLILKALSHGAKHGYGIVEHLRAASGEVLQVGESALYPALQRLLVNGWASAQWGTSDNNRRARYYTLTAAGRRQLAAERAEFERMVGGIQGVLGTA